MKIGRHAKSVSRLLTLALLTACVPAMRAQTQEPQKEKYEVQSKQKVPLRHPQTHLLLGSGF